METPLDTQLIVFLRKTKYRRKKEKMKTLSSSEGRNQNSWKITFLFH